MEQAIFTTLCMVYDDQNRILVQQRHGTGWDGLAFPGGHVEAGESFTKSVIREVYEETGYQIKNPVLCAIKQFQMESGARYVILLYKTNQFDGNLCSSEEGRVFWLERGDIPRSNMAHDMAAMMELFDDDEKSEFYYLPDHADGKYLIL